MKKTLAILLALMLVFSSIPVAFAEETLPADAQACKDLGMLAGSGNGVTTAYLAETPQRIQAAVMFLRLKGLEDEALAFTGTENFADAKDAAWATPIMAYLKAHPELGWIGSGNNAFEPTKDLDAASYYKVLLEALGYKQNTTEVIGDFVFSNVLDFAASKGLTKVAAVTNYTNNDLATATIEALKATVKGSEKTLGTSLVEAKVLTEAAAIAAGVYTVPADTAAPTVTSVTMTNLKEAVVVFSEKVDKDLAEDIANYTVSGTGITGVVADGATLAEDGMTVTLDLTAALPGVVNQNDVDFTIENIKDLAGNKMAKYTTTYTAIDTTLPAAEKVEVTGPQTMKVTFNEPIAPNTTPVVTLNNGVYSATVSTPISGNTITVNLGAALPAGSYTVKVSSAKDYAGFTMLSKEFTVAYDKDTTAPTVSVKSAKQNEVVVLFNKDVTGVTVDSFYHTFTAWKPNSVTPVSAKEYKLTFTTYPIPEGTANLVVKVNNGTTDIKDLWSNKLAADTTLAVTVTADKTAPTVTKVEATSESKVVVTFSEAVSNAAVKGNYTFFDKDGKKVDASKYMTPIYDADKYTATFNFTTPLAGGAYSVAFNTNIADTSLSANKLASANMAFTVSDKTAATISDVVFVNTAAGSPEYVYVTFSEDMTTSGTGSILDLNNYQWGASLATAEALPDETTIALFGSNAKVKITVPDGTVIPANLYVAPLKDALGNAMSAFVTETAIGADVAPVVTDVKTVGLNKLEISVDRELSYVDATKIKVDGKDAGVVTTAVASASYVNDSSDATSVITVVLPADENLANEGDKALVVEVVASAFKSLTGKANDADNDVLTLLAAEPVATITDGLAPAVAENVDGDKLITTADVDANGKIDHIVVQYTENIKSTSVSNLSYTVDGYTVLGIRTDADGVVATPATDGDGADAPYVVIRVKEKTTGYDTAATPVVTQVYDITDNAATPNKLVASAGVAALDKVAAIIVSADATVGSTELVVTFSEAVSGGTAIAPAGLIVTDFTYANTGAGGATAITVPANSGKVDNITLTLDVAAAGGDIGFDTLAAANIFDAAGNAMAATAKALQ